jgi:hypothetical protein
MMMMMLMMMLMMMVLMMMLIDDDRGGGDADGDAASDGHGDGVNVSQNLGVNGASVRDSSPLSREGNVKYINRQISTDYPALVRFSPLSVHDICLVRSRVSHRP